MFENSLIEKICNLEENIQLINVEKFKYDTRNPFSKYYSFKYISNAITKYLNKEIKFSYLLHWITLYNWILNGGFNNKANESVDEFIDLIRNEISWLLDSFSFAKEVEVEEYLSKFQFLDNVLNSSSKWEMYYTPAEEDEEEQYVLVVNNVDKIYFEVYSELYENGDETEKLVYLKNRDYNNKKNLLEALNYQEFEY
jgi:hypothetical protein